MNKRLPQAVKTKSAANAPKIKLPKPNKGQIVWKGLHL